MEADSWKEKAKIKIPPQKINKWLATGLVCVRITQTCFSFYISRIFKLSTFFFHTLTRHSNDSRRQSLEQLNLADFYDGFLFCLCVCVWACRFFVVSYILLLCPFLSFLFSPSWKASEASTELQRSVNGFSPCLTEFFFFFPPIFNCDYHVFFLPSFAVHYRAKAELSAVLLSIPRL